MCIHIYIRHGFLKRVGSRDCHFSGLKRKCFYFIFTFILAWRYNLTGQILNLLYIRHGFLKGVVSGDCHFSGLKRVCFYFAFTFILARRYSLTGQILNLLYRDY
jgi:hypothetical protein